MNGEKWLPVSQQPPFHGPAGEMPVPERVERANDNPVDYSILLERLERLENREVGGDHSTINAQMLSDGLLAAVRVGAGKAEATREKLGPLDLLNLTEGPSHLIGMVGGGNGSTIESWLVRVGDMLKRRVSIKATRDADLIALKAISFRFFSLHNAVEVTDEMLISGWSLYWKLAFAAIVDEEMAGGSGDMKQALRVGSLWQEKLPVDLSASSLRQWIQGAGRNALSKARVQAKQQQSSSKAAASQARGGKNDSGGGSGGGAASGSKTTPPK